MVAPHQSCSRVLQHELDHLDGILFLDRVVSPARPVPAAELRLSMAVAVSLELLHGSEELAYLGDEPARDARASPLPDELDRGVVDAIGVGELYSHQRAA